MPGSGKSTIARALAAHLTHLEVIDKDDFLDQLFGSNHDFEPSRRWNLSREVNSLMQHAANSSRGAILVSHWRRPEVSVTSGTPIEWLFDFPHSVEIHCTCPPTLAAERFMSRHRHSAHGDSHVNEADLLHQLTAIHELGPIGLAECITVDTTGDVDIAKLSNAVAQRLRAS